MHDEEDVVWQDLAVCRGMDTNWFYEMYESDSIFAAVMDDVCLSCPVKATCLAEAVDGGESGLWGGVFLTNGKVDSQKNDHKTEETWEGIRSGITG